MALVKPSARSSPSSFSAAEDLFFCFGEDSSFMFFSSLLCCTGDGVGVSTVIACASNLVSSFSAVGLTLAEVKPSPLRALSSSSSFFLCCICQLPLSKPLLETAFVKPRARNSPSSFSADDLFSFAARGSLTADFSVCSEDSWTTAGGDDSSCVTTAGSRPKVSSFMVGLVLAEVKPRLRRASSSSSAFFLFGCHSLSNPFEATTLVKPRDRNSPSSFRAVTLSLVGESSFSTFLFWSFCGGSCVAADSVP
mmetsp:Transcript_30296/g.84520  ORF Transcript_30296/g.84520 Transcript_30296/m.84520 type:complete len:251 (+) Transcript_30296:217-969(+)